MGRRGCCVCVEINVYLLFFLHEGDICSDLSLQTCQTPVWHARVFDFYARCRYLGLLVRVMGGMVLLVRKTLKYLVKN